MNRWVTVAVERVLHERDATVPCGNIRAVDVQPVLRLRDDRLAPAAVQVGDVLQRATCLADPRTLPFGDHAGAVPFAQRICRRGTAPGTSCPIDLKKYLSCHTSMRGCLVPLPGRTRRAGSHRRTW